jgi:hypothetical protein
MPLLEVDEPFPYLTRGMLKQGAERDYLLQDQSPQAAADYLAEQVHTPLAYMTPGVGDVMAHQDAVEKYGWAKDAFNEGRYLSAAAHGLGGLVDDATTIPLFGDAFLLAKGLGHVAGTALPVIAGTFGGIRARTANREMLDLAKEAEKKGLPMDRIRDATGWEKGVDDQWRFEIPDDTYKYTTGDLPIEEDYGRKYLVGNQGDAMTHPQLFNAYPEIAQTKHVAYPWEGERGTRGEFRPGFRLSDDSTQIEPSITMWNGPDPMSTNIHEVGHNVQEIENFARGGNQSLFKSNPVESVKWKKWKAIVETPEYQRFQSLMDSPEYADELAKGNRLWGEKYQPILDKLDSEYDRTRGPERFTPEWNARLEKYNKATDKVFSDYKKEFNRPVMDEVDALAEKFGGIWEPPNKYEAPYDSYKRLAGETEARNVQTRMNLTADDRAMLPPRLTEDVPRDEQIVRYDTGPSMSSEDLPMDEASILAGAAGLGLTGLLLNDLYRSQEQSY